MSVSSCPARTTRKARFIPTGLQRAKPYRTFQYGGAACISTYAAEKWRDSSTGEIFTYDFDNLTEAGSKLTPEFVAFLKEED